MGEDKTTRRCPMGNINTDAATSARASLDVAHWNTLQLFESVPAAEPVAAPCKEGASAAAAAAVWRFGGVAWSRRVLCWSNGRCTAAKGRIDSHG